MLRSDLPISLPFSTTITSKFETGFVLSQITTGAPTTGAVNTDLAIFEIPFKCKVYEAGVLVLADLAGTNPGPHDFRFDVRLTAGSDTGRTDGSAGIVYLYETGASAQGDYCYDLAGQTPYDNTDDTGCSLLEPGMQVVFQTGSTALTGTGMITAGSKVRPFLLVEYMPEVRGNLVNAQETT
jgi:hypothetical protein